MALLTGSGFATGQEILQYFAAYGLGGGLIVSLLCMVLLAFAGGCFISAGKREQFAKGSDVYRYYCGNRFGTFYDCFSILFIFSSFVVMMGGAGATMNQHFGLPNWGGSIVMMILTYITAISGLGGVVRIIGKIGPLIAAFSIFLGLYSMLANPEGVLSNSVALAAGEITVKQVGGSPVSAAISYAGFCILWLAAYLASLGKKTTSEKEGICGTVCGAVFFTAGCTAMMLGLLAFLPELWDAAIPALVLTNRVGTWLSVIFSIIIFCGIYTAAVPLLWQVSSRFTGEGTVEFRGVTAVIAAAGTVIALFIPFQDLVNKIYGLSGYVGIILLVFIAVKEIRRRLHKTEV